MVIIGKVFIELFFGEVFLVRYSHFMEDIYQSTQFSSLVLIFRGFNVEEKTWDD
jgi:hypothetical protein